MRNQSSQIHWNGLRLFILRYIASSYAQNLTEFALSACAHFESLFLFWNALYLDTHSALGIWLFCHFSFPLFYFSSKRVCCFVFFAAFSVRFSSEGVPHEHCVHLPLTLETSATCWGAWEIAWTWTFASATAEVKVTELWITNVVRFVAIVRFLSPAIALFFSLFWSDAYESEFVDFDWELHAVPLSIVSFGEFFSWVAFCGFWSNHLHI